MELAEILVSTYLEERKEEGVEGTSRSECPGEVAPVYYVTTIRRRSKFQV
jgi:hypothetical protein